MKWIRGPVWDSVFILSGLPLGLALLCLTGPWYDWPNPQHYGHSLPLMLVFMLVPLLETGHSLSPIALALSHKGFRRVMLERKGKFIVLPGAVFLGAAGIGAATSLGLTGYIPGPHRMFQSFLVSMIAEPTQWFRWGHVEFISFAFRVALTNPFPTLVWIYMVWNAYHFGMQNFGVLQIYQKKRGALYEPPPGVRSYPQHHGPVSDHSKEIARQRIIDKLFCLTVTCAAMATAFPVTWLHLAGVRDFCIALSLLATIVMLWREIYLGDLGQDRARTATSKIAITENHNSPSSYQGHISVPRVVFILADGLGLALVWWLPIVGFTIYSINHWLVALGLSGHVFGAPYERLRKQPFGKWCHLHRWAFVVVMLALGSVSFVWLIPTPNGTQFRVIPVIIAARLGLGLVHFLYDWWIWKRWSPIMRDLFPPPPLRLVA